MLRPCAVLLTASLLPLAASANSVLASIEKEQQRIFESVAPSVVLITSGAGVGSGFFVRADGLVLTNAHVVADRATVEVVLHDGRKVTGRVLERASGKIDLALVQADVRNVPALPLGPASRLRVGSWVAAVGHGAGAMWTFNTGMVSNIYPDASERPVFQTQIPVNPGNSGGPIVDRTGRVVGLVTAGINDAQVVNFGIRIDVALKAFALLTELCDCLVVHAPAGVPVLVDGKMAGTGPRVAIAAEPRRYEVMAIVQGQMIKRVADYPKVKRVILEPDGID